MILECESVLALGRFFCGFHPATLTFLSRPTSRCVRRELRRRPGTEAVLVTAKHPGAPARRIHVVVNWFEELKAKAGN